MVSDLKIFLFTWFFLMIAMTAEAATYHVRHDGGTAQQCSGLVDLPYPGSGQAQACAWSHPFWALEGSDPPGWRLQGGDTLIIHPGSYQMGYGAPNSDWCSIYWTHDCHLPPVPSGLDPEHPTRILGAGWDQGCANPPELWGSERPWQLLNLNGASDVVIECLELTDHSGCVEFHADPQVRCVRDSYPHGDWASSGIYAADSARVILKNLDIHGLASAGIRAGRIKDWTLENVRIAGNGMVGWEGDLGGSSSNSGTLTFRGWKVEWNGCAETYPGEQFGHCWAQPVGGYGDGVGTGFTGGHWIIEDSIFRYNTSDGLDLLYARDANAMIEIRRTMAYGNAGNQIKTTGAALLENVLAVGNCGYFAGKDFAPEINGIQSIDHCRAGGSAIALTFRQGNTISLVNSTIAGEGDCLLTLECDWNDSSCEGSETFLSRNNIFQGYQDFLQAGDQTCYLWFDQALYNIQWDYNIIYDAKIGDNLPPLGMSDILEDPQLLDASLESFDGHLSSTSPAVDTGLPVSPSGGLIPAEDIEGRTRPVGSGADRGAYEYGAAPGGATVKVAVGNFDADDEMEFAIAQVSSEASARVHFYDSDGALIGQTTLGSLKEISLAAGNFDDDSEDELVVACVKADGSLGTFIFDADGNQTGEGIGGQCRSIAVAAGNFDADGRSEYVVALIQSDGTLGVIFFDSDGKRMAKGVGGTCREVAVAVGNFDIDFSDHEVVVAVVQEDNSFGAIAFQQDGLRIGKGVGGVCSGVKVAAGNFAAGSDQDEYVVSLVQSDGRLAAITFFGNGTRIGKGIGGTCSSVNITAAHLRATSPLDGYAVSLSQADNTPAAIFFAANGDRIGKGAAVEEAIASDIDSGDMYLRDGFDEAILAYINQQGQMKWMVFQENGMAVMAAP